MLSFLIVFVLVVAAGWGAWRGWRRSTPESLIRLVVLFVCALISALLAPWIARSLPISLYKEVLSLMRIRGDYASYDGFDEVLRGFARGLAAPLIFLILFHFFLLVSSVILSLLFARSHREAGREIGGDKVEATGERAAGVVIGGLIGLCIWVICFSPLTGTLRTADRAIEVIRDLDGVRITVPNKKTRGTIHTYAETGVLKVLYAGGGQVLYETSARGYVQGQYFSVDEELTACSELLNDLRDLTDRMMSGERPEDADILRLREILERTEDSPICRLILLGQVKAQAEEWFLHLGEKEDLEIVLPVLEILLAELQEWTSYETVCTDLCTVVDVMDICYSMDFEGKDYEGMLLYLGEEGGMDNINRIIRQNPRLDTSVSALSEVVTLCFYRTVNAQQVTAPQSYAAFVSDLTKTLNSTVNYSDARREDTIRNCLQDYAAIMELRVNSQVLQSATYSIMDVYRDRTDVTEADIMMLFRGDGE